MSNDVLAAVRPLLPGIAQRARTTDDDRRVPVETVKELTAAGVFRMLQPTRYGGIEADPVDFYEVVRAVSDACASTGWVTSVIGVHPGSWRSSPTRRSATSGARTRTRWCARRTRRSVVSPRSTAASS
ncbi:acyl-CoA dehydrogenase family protein [Nocardioides sp. B-3]|uniref:acyl-CoA dehydrogenase family protein n=1 Tax=Nocardioides sp. B-3 TaxID=2895565 RepID=UPI002153802A|nr:acyl-CoA dehydrogenase family protein [Nocardioides sp. B-3]UUZ59435.1 acyl-CoA dehydrogenase family protein [Nocardioides sp. B-3]